MGNKPLGRKNYGSIPHLPNSRIGSADKHCQKGQAKIATVQARDKNDEIFVQEKLDGSNVGIAKVDGQILALTRAGYTTDSSPYEQHHLFGRWVREHYLRFSELLEEGQRLAGEWLAQAHGTRYSLTHEPFIAFDLLSGHERMPYDEFIEQLSGFEIVTPYLVHRGDPISVAEVMDKLGTTGFHGALDEVEGAIWRVERDKATGVKGEKKRVVDFLVKYVRPDKEDGIYFPSVSGKEAVWNWKPD